MPMKWASAISEGQDFQAALEQCAGKVAADLGPDAPPSLAVVFASTAYGAALLDAPKLLGARLPGALVFGCTGGGVIGAGQEVEDRPAVALTAGHLPGVRLAPFRATRSTCPSPDAPPDAWTKLVGIAPEARPAFLILMDPFTPPGEQFMAGLDFAYPAAAKVGGLASGGRRAGAHVLYLGGDTFYEGAVGVALTGDVVVDTVVAQGCRPIGQPKRITACQENILAALDGEPPFTYLRDLYPTLSPRDQELLATNLFLGIATDPVLGPEDAQPGDFLIRNIMGADQEQGILAIGEELREGQLVQFHVRDAMTSSEDLQRQLARYLRGRKDAAAGALMFQCNGRGAGLYGRRNHDSDLFRELAGPVPLGGFFCNGEIGPVGGATYLHGFTSSFALFRTP